jgi:rhodanese-related sulfurtransferase
MKVRLPLLGFLVVLMSFIACQNQAQTKENLHADDFEKGVAKGEVQILDVRTQPEYNSGHLKNAFLADWNNKKVFQERVAHLDKSKPVYTYCLVGGRSSAAADWLIANGFKEVYNLEGGIQAWKKSDKPVEGIQKVKQISLNDFRKSIPAEKTVLVDVGAKWCPPCKKMEPVIEALKQSHGNAFTLITVDGGEQENLAKELNAESFPTFIVYKNGKEVWRKSGIATKEELAQQVK